MQTEANTELPIPAHKARYHPDTRLLLVPQGYTLVDLDVMEAHISRTSTGTKAHSVCAGCPYYGYIHNKHTSTCHRNTLKTHNGWTTCPGYSDKDREVTKVLVPESMLPELLITRMAMGSGEKP